jgi:hypothetical protein
MQLQFDRADPGRAEDEFAAAVSADSPSCIRSSSTRRTFGKRDAIGLWKPQVGQESDGRRHHHQKSGSNLIPGACD